MRTPANRAKHRATENAEDNNLLFDRPVRRRLAVCSFRLAHSDVWGRNFTLVVLARECCAHKIQIKRRISVPIGCSRLPDPEHWKARVADG